MPAKIFWQVYQTPTLITKASIISNTHEALNMIRTETPIKLSAKKRGRYLPIRTYLKGNHQNRLSNSLLLIFHEKHPNDGGFPFILGTPLNYD